jgi:hypothetical protein
MTPERPAPPASGDTAHQTESQSAYLRQHADERASQNAPGATTMKNTHQQDRVAADRSNPPSGRNDDDTHALQAGKDGATQRRSTHGKEPSTRDAGSDDRRSGSESNRN